MASSLSAATGADPELIVVGAGMAGHCAALAGAQAGARVLLLEKMPQYGGSTAMCGGAFAFAGTDVQQAKGIEDDAARLAEAMQGGFADSAVLRHYAPAMLQGRYAGSTLNAVKDMDIALDLGRDSGTALPLSGVLAALYRLLVQQGHTQLGMAGVMRLYVEGALADAPRAGGDAAAAEP